MSNSTALVGSALVGQAQVGSLGDAAPPHLRASGGCWKRVTDPEIVKAAQDAKDYADTQDQTVLDQAASAAQDKADAAQAEAVRLAELAATEADEALEAALGDLVADKSNVFIQDVAPVAGMQKPGVLWIDTTPVAVDGVQVPGNVPKTWSGAAWVAITDSAVVQASAEAAAAHTAAEDAADAASEAMAEARHAPRTANRPPTQADGVDKPIGAGWHEYGETTNYLGITKDRLVQTWMWTGTAWIRLDMDPQMIPAIQIGTGTFGDLTGDRVTVTGTLSANIVDAMDVNAKKLVVSEEAILNHATLIGDTVVDNINVTGKLIGTDGVFTGTVDFENVNVTGLQLVEKLEAHSISADLIEGGAFTGESFAGGTFIGGEFRTSDALPGQVTLSDAGYTHSGTGVSRPGIRIDPEDSTRLAAAAGIGPTDYGFEIDGGRSTNGERTSITMHPSYSLIRADGLLAGTGVGDISVQPAKAEVVARKGAHQGSIQARPGDVSLYATHPDGAAAAHVAADTLSARLRAYRTDGSRAGAVEATDTTATVSVRDAAGTTRGSMEVSETGATSRSFSGNASESGWVRARPQDAELAYVDPSNVYASRILANASEASLYTSAGGTNRYLTVDANGVWVKTNKGGSWKQYNLEETAQDSGWTMATVLPGYTEQPGYPPKARKVGNLVYLSGGVSGAGIGANTSQYVLTLPPGYRPVGNSIYVVGGSSTGAACPLFVILPDGRVSLRTTATTGNYYLMDGLSFIPE